VANWLFFFIGHQHKTAYTTADSIGVNHLALAIGEIQPQWFAFHISMPLPAAQKIGLKQSWIFLNALRYGRQYFLQVGRYWGAVVILLQQRQQPD